MNRRKTTKLSDSKKQGAEQYQKVGNKGIRRLLVFFKEHRVAIGVLISAVFPAIYYFVNRLYVIDYQNDCEQFYQIPGKYFSRSIETGLI